MKDKIIIFLAVIVIALCGFGIWKTIQSQDLRERYDTAIQNNKAYESQLDAINEENRVFQFTVEQLKYINDSTINELDSVRQELKIKDNKIK